MWLALLVSLDCVKTQITNYINSQRKWHFPKKHGFSVTNAHFLCYQRFFYSQISATFCYSWHFLIKSRWGWGILLPELALQLHQTLTFVGFQGRLAMS